MYGTERRYKGLREAYDAIFNEHILESIKAEIPPLIIGKAKIIIEDVYIHKSFLGDREHISIDRRLLPRECRERNLTYKGRIIMRMSLFYDNKHILSENKNAGFFPIMVKSKLCHLNDVDDLSTVGGG